MMITVKIKNAAYNRHGTIDCDIEHPEHGWIPHTIDAAENPELHAAALATGPADYIPPSAQELLEIERRDMVCSRFQAKAAIASAGLLDAVNAAVVKADIVVQLAWSDAVEFRRNSPTIAAIQSAVDLTDEQVDDLFRAAMTIEA